MEGRQSGCCIYSHSAASPCPSRFLFCVPGWYFVVSLRAFLSLHSGTHTELFVFTNVFGDVPAIAGLRKLKWPLFLECPFYLAVSNLKNYSYITANSHVMEWKAKFTDIFLKKERIIKKKKFPKQWMLGALICKYPVSLAFRWCFIDSCFHHQTLSTVLKYARHWSWAWRIPWWLRQKRCLLSRSIYSGGIRGHIVPTPKEEERQ